MKAPVTRRLLWLLWFAALAGFVAVGVFPLSTRLTRTSGLVLLTVAWVGLIALTWPHRWFRFTLLALTALTGGFLAWPSSRQLDAAALRSDYAASLRRYEGVTYYWGGESTKGIDCSGLIRRGLVDALFLRGLRTADPGLVRRAIGLWWHDSTAEALGTQHRRLTVRLFETPSLNALDHRRLVLGDLAVTRSGIHILAYLGNDQWIEADPMVGRVITVVAPSSDNGWFHGQMKIVRWTVLSD